MHQFVGEDGAKSHRGKKSHDDFTLIKVGDQANYFTTYGYSLAAKSEGQPSCLEFGKYENYLCCFFRRCKHDLKKVGIFSYLHEYSLCRELIESLL